MGACRKSWPPWFERRAERRALSRRLEGLRSTLRRFPRVATSPPDLRLVDDWPDHGSQGWNQSATYNAGK